MVLSGSKKTTYQSSIKNRNQGGGDKKAGIPPTANVSHVSFLAYGLLNTANGPNVVSSGKTNGLMSLTNMRTNRFSRPASQNLPMGFNAHIQMR
jgi:hypothetical protein